MSATGGSVTRRRFVASSIAGAAGAYALADPLLGRAASRVPAARDVVFGSGVASGQPGQRAITLWTQLDGLQTPSRLRVEIARDPGFANVIARTQALADPAAGGTARVRIGGRFLAPGQRYWYRFVDGRGNSSRVGRFGTALPPNSTQPVKIAFFACQDFLTGWYTAHRDLAAQDPDIVVALGDYIYETAYFQGRVRDVPKTPDGQCRTLGEYRAQYRTYNGDQDLQAVRALAPMAVIWDDHEVEDNYAALLPGGHEFEPGADGTPARDIPFATRRASAYQAFFESHPIIRAAGDRDRIYGSQRHGMVELFKLDTRQFRTDQPCNPSDAFIKTCDSQYDTMSPNATQMGAAQRSWLLNGLKASRAPWKLIANQVMIMALDILPGVPVNTDSWDGYSVERAMIADFITQNKIKDVAFLTGDIHTFFAGQFTRTGRADWVPYAGMQSGPVVAPEFVVSSITSQGIADSVVGIFETIGNNIATGIAGALNQPPPDTTPKPNEGARNALAEIIDPWLMNANQHYRYVNSSYKGYGLVTVSSDAMRVKFRATHDVRDPRSQPFTIASFIVPKGQPYMYRDATASAAAVKRRLPVDRKLKQRVSRQQVIDEAVRALKHH